MKTLDDYMKDPDISRIPMPLREVKAIRLMLYDETKDMTPAQYKDRLDKITEVNARKYGFKVVKSAKEGQTA